MLLLKILILTNAIVDAAIPKRLYDYIKSNDRLDRYSLTLLMQFDKNSTNEWYEEKFYWKKQVSGLNNSLLNGKVLNVAICKTEDENDCYFDDDGSRNPINEVFGTLGNILKFRVKYDVFYYKSNEIESLNSNLTNNSIDLILCYPGDNDSFKVIHPILKTRYVLIYKQENISLNQDIFVLTFAGTLWLCFVILIILLAICLNFATKQYSRIYDHPSWGTVDITFWAIAAACQQGLSSTPVGFSSRLIFFLGYLTAYLLYTGFAAGITSLVAVQNEDYVLTVSDIEKMKLNIVSFGDTSKIVSKYPLLRNGYDTKLMDDFFRQLDENGWIGLTTSLHFERFLLKNGKKFNPCSHGVTYLEKSEIVKSFVPKDSKYRKLLNYWLIHLEQSGIVDITTQHIRKVAPICSELTGYSSASLQHVGSAIMLIIAGLVGSLVFLTIECIWNGYKHRRNNVYKNMTTHK